MKATDNFFAQKHSWSRLKDEILFSYLTPYITKISYTRHPIAIVDCFAGKGSFDDGEKGSPLFIAQAIKDFKAKNRALSEIQGAFVEKKYFKELQENLCSFTECELIENDYESWANEFVKADHSQRINLLLYVDPYGIKPLPFHHFEEICRLDLKSFEMLLNFNSRGFLREGCRLLKVQNFECNDDDEIYAPDEANSISRMNAIANGNYWQKILASYDAGVISMKEAEIAFCEAYANELKNIFDYVVNIPIKAKKSHIPKYRLIFGTNSEDGLLLMADKMSRTWRDFIERERNGQLQMFECIEYPDENHFNYHDPKEAIWDLISEPLDLKTLLVKLIEIFGICYPESELKKICKRMEKEGELKVTRKPSKTPRGKDSTSWEYKNYEITLRRGRSCQKTLL